MKILNFGVVALLLSSLFTPLYAGIIIVSNDEWTLSNTGFVQAPVSTEKFVSNMASLFSKGGAGTFHAYSKNFGFTESSLSATLSNAGHIYSTGTNFAFTQSNISNFDAIFLGGTYLSSSEITTLINYVNSGGNIYLAGGTGIGGGARVEAAAWNPFLNSFGMSFTESYNNIFGNVDVTSATHPVFNGVSELYQNTGSSIVGTGIEVSLNGQGLFAVVPLPSAFVLFISGLGLFVVKIRNPSHIG